MHSAAELDYKPRDRTEQWKRILDKPVESYGESEEFKQFKEKQQETYRQYSLHLAKLKREGKKKW